VPWYYAVAEREHTLQNPTSPEKIRLLGERLRLGPGTRVLDAACGKAGPAVLLASTFGCSIVGVERSPEFAAEARANVAAAGLSAQVEIVEGDARGYPLEPEAWDVALCLGASFVWDDIEGTLAALTPAVRAGGYIAVGEPFWQTWPLPEGVDSLGYLPLRDTVGRLEDAGLALVTMIASSRDDWDRYESLHWQALEEWLAEHPDDPDAAEIRARHERAREDYLRVERTHFDWAIFVGWKRG